MKGQEESTTVGQRDALENVCATSAVKIVSRTAEKMQPWRCWKRSVGKDRPWSKHALITETSLIACGGKKCRTSPDNLIDRLRNDAVLKHGLGKIEHVIGDDLRTGRCQRLNIAGIRSYSIQRRGKS